MPANLQTALAPRVTLRDLEAACVAGLPAAGWAVTVRPDGDDLVLTGSKYAGRWTNPDFVRARAQVAGRRVRVAGEVRTWALLPWGAAIGAAIAGLGGVALLIVTRGAWQALLLPLVGGFLTWVAVSGFRDVPEQERAGAAALRRALLDVRPG